MPDIDQVARSQIADLQLVINQTAGALASITANPITFTYNPANASVAGVATDIFGSGIIKVMSMTATLTGPATYTLPSIASIIAALPTLMSGQTFGLRIMNLSSQTWTIAASAGWSLTGVMTIATATWRDFQIQYLSPTSMLLSDMGQGTTASITYPFTGGATNFSIDELLLEAQPLSKPSDPLWPSLWPLNQNEWVTQLLHTWAIPLTNASDPIDPIMAFGPTPPPSPVLIMPMFSFGAGFVQSSQIP